MLVTYLDLLLGAKFKSSWFENRWMREVRVSQHPGKLLYYPKGVSWS